MKHPRPTPRFIAFEGCDASGKSTQARLLADRLGALLTREPGGTAGGRRIRSLLLDHSPEGRQLDVRAEALLMAADRAQHVAEVLRPGLAAGLTIVSDRYIGSSLAYQGYGRGLAVAEVRRISEWATGGLWPDVIVLLRVPLETAMTRLSDERMPDRLENEGAGFLTRVIAGYDAMAAAEPERWRIVDGVGEVDTVADRVWAAVDGPAGPAPAIGPRRLSRSSPARAGQVKEGPNTS